MKNIKRLLVIILGFILIVSCSITAVSFAAENGTAYGWQGLGNPESPDDINQILMKEPGAEQIQVVHSAQNYDDYYENRITEPIDGSEGVRFVFAMNSGMGNFDPERFSANNMDLIKILDENREVAAEYDGGNGELYLNEELSHGKIGDDNSTASIVIEVAEGVLSEGGYILRFDENVCGNNTTKILGVPIEFHFDLEVVSELASLIEEVQNFVDEAETYEEGERGAAGTYPESAVEGLKNTLADAIETESSTDPDNDEDKALRKEKARELYNAFMEVQDKVVVQVNSVDIMELEESVYVGTTGTALAEVSATPDNKRYHTVRWSVTPENGCISIDTETGEWSANYAGNAVIKAESTAGTKWDSTDDNNVVAEKKITVEDKTEGATEVYLREGGTLQEILEKRTKSEQVDYLKIYTAPDAVLSEDDIKYINGLSNLKTLDIFGASCSELELSNVTVEKIVLPENINTIASNAFSGCSQLENIEIPASVTSISCNAFNGCEKLTGALSVWSVMPPELKDQNLISDSALFRGCGITSVKVPYRSSEDYQAAEGWNCGITIEEAETRDLELKNVQNGTLKQRAEKELQNLNLDESQIDRVVITTGDSFLERQDIEWLRANCLNAAELDLSRAAMKDSPDASGSKIKANTFKNRVLLKTVKLPDPIESISQSAFAGCENLREVEFPTEIGKINDGAFRGCKKLQSVIYLGCVTPPDFEGEPFDRETVKTFVVPVQSVEKYKSSYGWKDFDIAPDITITLNKSSISLEVPATAVMTADVKTYTGDSRTVFWSSNNPGVADVKEETGTTNTIITKKAGTATITASDATGAAKAVCTVKVKTLAAPATVKAVSVAYNKITVSWTGVKNAQYYQVFRCNSKGSTIGDPIVRGSAVRSYTYIGLTTGTKYYFKVRAYKKVNKVNYFGSYSSVKSAVPTLATPGSLSISKSSSSYVKVKWKGISGETGYQVYRATSKGGNYSKVASVKMASYKYPYAKIKTKKGKTYYYKVRAYKNVGGKLVYSSFSSPKAYKLK
ncbi:MAG: leucine-rich repeat protein [Lentihominibacter sp.]